MKSRPYEKSRPRSTISDGYGVEEKNLSYPSSLKGGANDALRPRYSPKAPRNYTQYIIHDQGNDKALDLEKEEDFHSYVAGQFEHDFISARNADLAGKTVTELQETLSRLEEKVMGLENQLGRCSHSYVPDASESSNDDPSSKRSLIENSLDCVHGKGHETKVILPLTSDSYSYRLGLSLQ